MLLIILPFANFASLFNYAISEIGPWTQEDERRNEVWLLKMDVSPSSGSESSWTNKQSAKIVSSDESTEMISHEVLKTTKV